jgi:hypothetical protein
MRQGRHISKKDRFLVVVPPDKWHKRDRLRGLKLAREAMAIEGLIDQVGDRSKCRWVPSGGGRIEPDPPGSRVGGTYLAPPGLFTTSAC